MAHKLVIAAARTQHGNMHYNLDENFSRFFRRSDGLWVCVYYQSQEQVYLLRMMKYTDNVIQW